MGINPRKLVLSNKQSPGDVLMLTAAVRDLHLSHPGQFLTEIRTCFPYLWENNPHVTEFTESRDDVRFIECEYPSINRSNQGSHHFINGFYEFLCQQLDVRFHPSVFKGDVHLSGSEMEQDSMVAEIVGEDVPYWIIVGGGKFDYTIKWWSHRRFQQVVDHFRGRLLFVQVGAPSHYHPRLDGVIDLRGKTRDRDIIRLTHRAEGVVCPVTFMMHLAAAVEMVSCSRSKNRPCVVIAGGREPPQWEAYPHHQFIHTVGSLDCCAGGGCWRSRTVPLGDGSGHDESSALCVKVSNHLPRCMDLIESKHVIDRIQLYIDGGMASELCADQRRIVQRMLAPSLRTRLSGVGSGVFLQA